MFSALVASIVSFTGEPYSIASPKKVFVQNVHKMQPDGSLDSVFTVGAVDSISVVELLSKQRIHQSSSSYQTTENVYVDAPRLGWEWQVILTFTSSKKISHLSCHWVVLSFSFQHHRACCLETVLLSLISKRLALSKTDYSFCYFNANASIISSSPWLMTAPFHMMPFIETSYRDQ